MRGRPLTLRCPKCKRGEDFRVSNRGSGRWLYLTGREAVATTYGRRHHVPLLEVIHGLCGHAFWTDHLLAETHRPAREAPFWAITSPRTLGRRPAGVPAGADCGAVSAGVVCTRALGHGGKLHVARGMGGRVVRSWPTERR